VEMVLRYNEAEVARTSEMVQLKAGSNDVELAFQIKEVSTWSPETPNLYELTA
jgi:beta-galactosidase/beta-glucuronidase